MDVINRRVLWPDKMFHPRLQIKCGQSGPSSDVPTSVPDKRGVMGKDDCVALES